jgi:predicted SnoaL-like aldol condensation-catalyzing enzyme
MTHIEIAKSLVGTFVTGDVATAEAAALPSYKQHNLAFGDGRDAFIAAVTGLQEAPVKTTLETVRAFEDGDYVVLHSKVNFAGSGDQVAIDVFRFEGDKIAEHWDNVDAVVDPNPSGHTQLDGATEVTDLDKTAANKAFVTGFVNDVLRGEHPEKIADYLAGEDYVQHNTGSADGLSGVSAAFAAMAEAGQAMVYDKVFKILGQGNFVLAMGEGEFAGMQVAFYDLFRVAEGKIVEHWDVIQEIPAKSEWANQNGKF